MLVEAKLARRVTDNPARAFDRRAFLGQDRDALNPPSDVEVAEMVEAVRAWRPEMALLMTWLRETGMRLAEALHLRAEDVHPGGGARYPPPRRQTQ